MNNDNHINQSSFSPSEKKSAEKVQKLMAEFKDMYTQNPTSVMQDHCLLHYMMKAIASCFSIHAKKVPEEKSSQFSEGMIVVAHIMFRMAVMHLAEAKESDEKHDMVSAMEKALKIAMSSSEPEKKLH